MSESIFSKAKFEESKSQFLDRAGELDAEASIIEMRLTLEEADNILTVWGLFLEHAEGLRFLFIQGPESCLPFPKSLIAAACLKMARHYQDLGRSDLVNMVENVHIGLLNFVSDDDSLETFFEFYSDTDQRKRLAEELKEFQLNRMRRGYVVQRKLWTIDPSRLADLLDKRKT